MKYCLKAYSTFRTYYISFVPLSQDVTNPSPIDAVDPHHPSNFLLSPDLYQAELLPPGPAQVTHGADLGDGGAAGGRRPDL